MSYKVYLVSSAGMSRNHHAIFIETNLPASGRGHIYQVTGNIQAGMTYEDHASTTPPEEDPSFIDRVLIGTVDTTATIPTTMTATVTGATTDPVTALLESIRTILCSHVPPPKKQFEGARRLFPQEPIRRCQEWTAEAIQSLVEAGVLKRELGQ